MRVHHLNCGSLYPYGSRLLHGHGSWLGAGHLCCHCLLVETNAGLVLVDSGLGTMDLRDPLLRLGRAFAAMGRIGRDESLAAVHQVRALGFSPEDVRHVILTHMDLDHAGGLADFPRAKVHVHALEYTAAHARDNLRDKNRYVPAQWAHGPVFQVYREGGETWNGFAAIRALVGLPEEILLVPLAGHTRGHTGVAVWRGGRWLLHAGDAYFHHAEMEGDKYSCPGGLRAFQSLVETDRAARKMNQARLRQLVASRGDVSVFCAHDLVELDRMSTGTQIAPLAYAAT
jgi:glyoxylase-like metal-dependent hydrolase (beta-lactamase superfamily II)